MKKHWLKTIVETRGVTQRQLAAVLGWKQASTVTRVFAYQRELRIEELCTLSVFLQIGVAQQLDLLGYRAIIDRKPDSSDCDKVMTELARVYNRKARRANVRDPKNLSID